MILSAMSVLDVAQSSSEIPEGLMNNPVFTNRQSLTSLETEIFIITAVRTFRCQRAKEAAVFVCLFVFVCFWRYSRQWSRASSFTTFLDHTQRCTKSGRTPLDELSARRGDLYLTTHNTPNRQTSMSPVGF